MPVSSSCENCYKFALLISLPLIIVREMDQLSLCNIKNDKRLTLNILLNKK